MLAIASQCTASSGAGPGAMGYMMSRAGYLAGRLPNDALWALRTSSDVLLSTDRQILMGCKSARRASHTESAVRDGPEPITEFVIPVGKWSDGTTARKVFLLHKPVERHAVVGRENCSVC